MILEERTRKPPPKEKIETLIITRQKNRVWVLSASYKSQNRLEAIVSPSIMDYSDDDGMLDIESGEDNLYGDDVDPGFAEEDNDNDSASQLSYVILKEEDIHEHQRTDIEQVSTVLSISQAESIALLLHYQWSTSKVEDEWFTDEERVRKTVGIVKEPVVDLNHTNIICGICFESYFQKDIATVSCGHPYCMTCWTGYITAKITGGPGCLMVTCPEPSCSAVVVSLLFSCSVISNEEYKEKYYRYFFRSYVESSGIKDKVVSITRVRIRG
ncbi:unnamed protein product [Brassica oleracea]